MFRWFSAVKRSTQVQPCRPVLEGLEGRRLMSATLLDTELAAQTASHGTGAGAGKVSMQDFHFVMRNNSASPKLFLASGTGAGAGKVSMQDFHFVMRNNSASPT